MRHKRLDKEFPNMDLLAIIKDRINAEPINIVATHDDIKPFPDDWIKRFNDEELERLAIMTVDGGLSDSDALIAMGI